MAHQLSVPNPRMYKREAKKLWTACSRHPKRQRSSVYKQVKIQSQNIRRDPRFINEFIDAGATLNNKQATRLGVIRILFDYQWHMYANKMYHVEDRIVSLQQPYMLPIQRGKANAKVEFGGKVDFLLSEGIIALERFDFSAFTESVDFKETLDRYYELYGQYPDKVLADTLYRNGKNMKLCKDLGIKIFGLRLGAKPKHASAEQRLKDTDAGKRRGAIERRFAFLKGSVGLDLANSRIAESLAVKINQAVVLSNVLTLLRVFAVPILILAQYEGDPHQLRYKVTTKVKDMAV